MISALIFLCIRKLEQTAHLAVGVSSVVVMMAMHALLDFCDPFVGYCFTADTLADRGVAAA